MSQKRGCCSGGAGGTFVSINGRRNPLVIAGGGGGTRGYEEDDPDGQPGNLEVKIELRNESFIVNSRYNQINAFSDYCFSPFWDELDYFPVPKEFARI